MDDRNEEAIGNMPKALSGKLFGDRGYISKELYDKLEEMEIKLIRKKRLCQAAYPEQGD